MNIFYLSNDVDECARLHLDRHVVKMILEYAQLMSTAHHVLDGKEASENIYKATHINHPCAIWTRRSSGNYEWLYNLFCALHREFQFRYEKDHMTFKKMEYVLSFKPKNISINNFWEPPTCMPDEYKNSFSVTKSYKNYYALGKKNIHSWKKREVPLFINEILCQQVVDPPGKSITRETVM